MNDKDQASNEANNTPAVVANGDPAAVEPKNVAGAEAAAGDVTDGEDVADKDKIVWADVEERNKLTEPDVTTVVDEQLEDMRAGAEELMKMDGEAFTEHVIDRTQRFERRFVGA